MTREEAISVLEESKRQNEIMRDNPNTFFKVPDIVTGEKNAQKRIDALNMAIYALRQQESKPQWISVKDRLPSEADLVTGRYHSLIIVCDKDGEVGFTYWDCGLGMRNEDVAYWMPLPEKPEEGTV